MVLAMNQRSDQSGVLPQSWLQHNLPWLSLFALLMGLLRDDSVVGFDSDELNG